MFGKLADKKKIMKRGINSVKKPKKLELLEESEYLINELVKEIKNCLYQQELEKKRNLMRDAYKKPTTYNGVGSNSGGCTACRARLWAPHNP